VRWPVFKPFPEAVRFFEPLAFIVQQRSVFDQHQGSRWRNILEDLGKFLVLIAPRCQWVRKYHHAAISEEGQ
jgi:hypothetical protein